MSESDRHTDTDLVAAFRAGERNAFADIYDRHSARVFSYFLGMGDERSAAVEHTHDTFIEAASRLDRSEEPKDLEAWLLRVGAGVAGLETMDEYPSGEVTAAPPGLRSRVLGKVDRERDAASGAAKPKGDWVSVAVFAVVTISVGLIGLAVSGQFEPLDPQPAPETTEPDPAAEASTTSTSTTPPTTVPADPGATPSTEGSAPAVIEVSTGTVDLGTDGIAGQFLLTNTGSQAGEWQLEPSSGAITLSAGQGELDGGDSVTIDVSLDREEIEEGELSETVSVSWDGGEAEISVVGSHEANPIIHNPQASPSSVEVSGDPACTSTQTTVSARIRDASPLESVVARWSPDGGSQQETTMSAVGNDIYEGVIGPFTVAQSASVRIVAFDDRGNAGGATAPVTVVECP